MTLYLIARSGPLKRGKKQPTESLFLDKMSEKRQKAKKTVTICQLLGDFFKHRPCQNV
jgi:hypothetical protein